MSRIKPRRRARDRPPGIGIRRGRDCNWEKGVDSRIRRMPGELARVSEEE